MENINEALSLLVIGMLAVFIILILVTVIGNTIIRFTNRFIPDSKLTTVKSGGPSGDNEVHPRKMAAIIAAVDILSKGKGSVHKIEKKSDTK